MSPLPATKLSAFLAATLFVPAAFGQGVLIVTNTTERVPLPRPVIRPQPTPPMSYKIKELSVQARLVDQVARVQVTQSFVNTGSRPMEVSFIFPLPYDGAIDQMTFMIDGREYPAKLLPAGEARRIYEGYVRQNRDPALFEWIGTGMFQTSVFPVPPGAVRQVSLRYSQLLRKVGSLTDFLFPLSTAKYTSEPVEKIELQATIESSIEIKNVYSPTHPIDIKRPDTGRAVVSYVGQNQVPLNDFRLFFDVAKGQLGAGVISYRPDKSDEGYLLLLASPEIKAPDAQRPPKTVVCVFDRSGSMAGKKIQQSQEALKFILNNLRDGDLFNIIAYDSQLEAFRPELQKYDDTTRKQALGFVEGLYAGGGTNIDGALRMALGMFQDRSRPSYVIFLTDGLPTVGETNEGKILEAVKAGNAVRARLLAFGAGYDVNSRLLDRLTRDNFGRSEFVRADEDIELYVSRLYRKVSSPVMTDVSVRFEFDAVPVEQGEPVNRLYPRQVGDMFEGEQLVLVGRYKKTGLAKVKIAGRVASEERKFDFPATLVESSADQSSAFVEKLWAMRRIGEIIDELDLRGKNDELIQELVQLSGKHGILTPYTSFLADENAAPGSLAGGEANSRRAAMLLDRLHEADGKAAFAQRAEKNQLKFAERPASPSAAPGVSGSLALRDIDRDEAVAVNAVQVVGDQVLYRRGNTWYSYDVAQATTQPGAKIKVIERFSDEYFRLVQETTRENQKILAAQRDHDEVIIRHPAAQAGAPAEVYRVK